MSFITLVIDITGYFNYALSRQLIKLVLKSVLFLHFL